MKITEYMKHAKIVHQNGKPYLKYKNKRIPLSNKQEVELKSKIDENRF